MFGLMGVARGSEVTKTAICEITNTSGVYPIYGTITLTQTGCPNCSDHGMRERPPKLSDLLAGNVTITVKLKGFNSSTTSKHGFHVHEHGDLGNNCNNAGGHYNPANFSHGAPTDFPPMHRHVGDLGNIEAVNGVVDTVIMDWLVSLFQHSVIGRSFVVHAYEDDLGRGNNSESLKTGNAGPRYGCCVITEVEQNETLTTTTESTTTSIGASSVVVAPSLLVLQLIIAFILSDQHH